MKTKFNGILTLLLAFVVHFSFAQERTISGTVSDKDGTLPGVSVLIRGTTTGTETDFDGKFSIKAKTDDVLVFSYLGYVIQEKKVSISNTISVVLVEDTNVLEEVVVKSYGRALNSKKSTIAVARVSGKDIEQVPINSVDQVLQGAAAGVNVNTGSGQPGQSGTIIIRGISSLSGDIEPLFIIDGIPVDQDNFRSLNQNDIETIDVLKDAAATSLYGNRGAGGVILITTKRGKIGQNLTVQYRSLYGVGFKPKAKFEVMNSSQFLNWQNENGIGLGANLSPTEISAISNQANTNWEDIFFRLGNTMSHEINFSSGTELSTSYTSVNYYKQEGVTLGSALERFSFRSNNNGSSKDKRFNYSTNVTLNYSSNNFIVDANRGGNTGGQLDNPFIVPYIGLPYLNPYNPDGSINTVGTFESGALNADGSINADGANGFDNTPFLALNTSKNQTDQENEIRAILGLNADYKLSDKFTVGTQFGLDYQNIQSLFITPPGSTRGLITPSPASENKGSQFEGTFRDAQFITSAFLRFEDEITDKLSLSAQVVGEYIYRNIQNEGFNAFGLNAALPGSGNGFTAGNTVEYPGGDPTDATDATYNYIPNVFSSESELALGSVLATLDLDYNEKYGIFASIRRDETSRFPNNSEGYFWSVSGRWNIDQEDFLSDSDWLSTLKLRASYGTTGNQNVGSFYQGRQQVTADATAYQGQLGYFVGQINSQDIRWETKESLNIGLSFGLWNNKLSGELDYYNEKTVDLFGSDNRSFSETGFNNVTTNVGSLRNRGVDLQISYVLLDKTATNNWSIKLNANGNYNKDEILDVPGGFTGNTLRNAVGKEAGTWFLERWAGVDPSNGQPLYLDVNGDITNEYSTANRVYLDKSIYPTYTGGFGGDFSYKGFSLSTLFSFQADVWKSNGSLAIVEDVGLASFANQSTTMLDAWTTPGQVTAIPAVSYGGLRSVDGDRYIEDASFLRLRNISLSYNLAPEYLAKTKAFKGMRIFVQGTNLFTWSKWRGFDPENNASGGFFEYPVPRTFTLGFDLTF